ncbi:MAG: cupin domain-containing protein [Acidimicrobiia bacterium]|nr:cupin domain-containing protein [Acidimicrobiia bacterium]
MKYTHENDVEAIRAPEPNPRTLKHLAAPWTIGSKNLWVGLSEVDPGSESNAHSHERTEEVFYVVSGEGYIAVGGERQAVSAGSVVVAPPGKSHQLQNPGSETLKVICSAAPAFAKEDFDLAHNLDEDN